MGSPQNKLGNDPEGTDPGTQLWLNAVGPSTGKQQGERYGSKLCNASPREFGCSSSSSTEYATDGDLYAVDVSSVVPGQPLTFQVFDGNYVNTGSTCDRTWRNSNGNTVTMMPTAASLTSTQWNALVAKFPDAATRFGSPTATAGAAAFCPGDAAYAGSSPVGNVSTTYVVRAPDTTEWSDTDNPVVSTATCAPVTMGALNPTSATNIYDQLMGASSGVVNPNDGVLTFAETFHRFATVCSIPSGSVQTGLLVVGRDRGGQPLLGPGRVRHLGPVRGQRHERHGLGPRPAADLRQRQRREHAVLRRPGAALRRRPDTAHQPVRHG
jgi:hypothetical protein